MKGLLLRKAFYDGWDSVLFIMLVNTLLIFVVFMGLGLAHFTAATFTAFLTIFIIGVLLTGVFILPVSDELALVAANQPVSYKRYFCSLKKYILRGPVYILITVFFLVLFPLAVHWYFSLGGTVGFVLGMLMFWIAVVFYLSFQWFLPIRSQLEDNFPKAIRKCFIIFFDNPGLSAFLLLYSLGLLIISLVPFLLLPGISGIILAQNEAFRLLMRKYDWMEDHPEIDFAVARKKVPWDEILADDYDIVDARTLKNLVMPWKE